MFRPNLNFVALPVPKIMAIEVLGGGCKPPILGKRRPYGVENSTVRNSVSSLSSYRPNNNNNSNFSSIFTCFRYFVAIVLQLASFFPPHL